MPDPLERKVTVGQQRFADVIAGKLFLLEHHNPAALARENCRRRRAGGPAANHDGVIEIIPCTCCLLLEVSLDRRKNSGIARVAMFRQEKLVQQPVDLQQAVAVQPHIAFIKRQKTLILQLAQRPANRCRMSTPNLLRKYAV